MTSNPNSRLRHPLTWLLSLLIIALVALVLPSVAHAQSTAPTVSSVAITSSPGMDNTYVTGDTITVSLTFSEAVTVTGTPYVVVDIGGQPRNFKYSGDGSSAAAQPFSYTVLVGDRDGDGVSLQVNSLTLNGGTIQSTDDSANATLTHAAVTFADHKVDTQVTLLSNLGQANAPDTITISATESAIVDIVVAQDKAFDINAITLDVKTLSDTLDVTVRLLGGDFADYTYTGSVTAAGLQTFTLSGPSGVSFGNVGWADFGQPYRYQIIISGSGAGSVELVGTESINTDAGGVSGLSIRSREGTAAFPQIRLSGHRGAIPNLMYGDVLSSPPDGSAYAAGDRITFLFVFTRPVEFPQGITIPFWLGNDAEDRREASLIENPDGYYQHLFFPYTVQPGDTDSDGIFLGADPLGDNAGIDIHSEETPAVPAYLGLAANQLAASQSVDGSGPRTCEEVFCSTVLVGENRVGLEATLGFSISVNSSNDLPFVPLGASSALSFGYGGEEYVVTELVFLDQAFAGLDLRFAYGLPRSHYDRLALSVDGTLFLLSEVASSSRRYRFQWSDPDLPWAAGDEIDVKLIETATATFDAASYTKTEGDPFDVTVTLGDPFANTLTLPVVVAGNGGGDATDYSGIPENLVFAPGDTVKTFTVTIVDDEIDDDDESFTISFGEESHIKSGGTYEEIAVTITDNDDPQVTVSFGASTYTVSEGGTQSVTVELSADPERTVVIPLVATGQEGADAADYTVPTGVTFDSGEMSKAITFTAAQDDEDDDNESVRLSFGAMPDLRVSPGATDEATITIDDDDDPFVEVQFAQNSYTVPEGGTQAVTVTLSADPERTVDIPLVATAQGGADITDYSVPLSVTFSMGQTYASVTLTATQDGVDDDNESVRLAIGAILPARVSRGATNETTVSIADDDDPHVTVMFAQAGYRVVEGDTVAVRVTLSADPERPVAIPMVATGQVGATDDDYSGVPDNLTINAGETSKTFEFMATADDASDTGESVKISFGASPCRPG